MRIRLLIGLGCFFTGVGLIAIVIMIVDLVHRFGTTMAFDHNRSRWFGIGYLIAESEGPSFISSTVAHHRLDGQCS